MSRFNELDGFQLLSGLVSVIAGPVMLLMGAPAGWAFLIMAAGSLVLVAQWAIHTNVSFDRPSTAAITFGVLGIVCVGVAVVYLTRAANDLPTMFPGYDPDTENFQLIPGILTLVVGVVALGRAVATVRVTRPPRHGKGVGAPFG
jgi:hypothetical protein